MIPDWANHVQKSVHPGMSLMRSSNSTVPSASSCKKRRPTKVFVTDAIQKGVSGVTGTYGAPSSMSKWALP